MAGDKQKISLKQTAFAQQKISAWQPVVAPRWVIIVISLWGVSFLCLGIVLLYTSSKVAECSAKYGDPDPRCRDCETRLTLSKENCVGRGVHSSSDGPWIIPKPVYVYYSLTRFYQNHRRYLLSRSEAQLQGELIMDTSRLEDCEPALYAADNYKILSPCGLAARSVFNDTIRIMRKDQNLYPMREGVDDIVWPESKRRYYKNPADDGRLELNKIDQWLNETIFPGKVENAHFMVWMRSSALSNFRKFYGIVDEDIEMPVTISILNRYPVASFDGEKFVILTTTSWLGGRNPVLGGIYTALGSLLFMAGCFMATRNRQDPRVLGDVRFLKWNKAK